MARSKKVVFFGKWAVILVTKSLQNTSMSYSGYEMAFYKNLRIGSLFYIFRAFRIHLDINFSVRNKLKKCKGANRLPNCSGSQNAGFWAFLG